MGCCCFPNGPTSAHHLNQWQCPFRDLEHDFRRKGTLWVTAWLSGFPAFAFGQHPPGRDPLSPHPSANFCSSLQTLLMGSVFTPQACVGWWARPGDQAGASSSHLASGRFSVKLIIYKDASHLISCSCYHATGIPQASFSNLNFSKSKKVPWKHQDSWAICCISSEGAALIGTLALWVLVSDHFWTLLYFNVFSFHIVLDPPCLHRWNVVLLNLMMGVGIEVTLMIPLSHPDPLLLSRCKTHLRFLEDDLCPSSKSLLLERHLRLGWLVTGSKWRFFFFPF